MGFLRFEVQVQDGLDDGFCVERPRKGIGRGCLRGDWDHGWSAVIWTQEMLDMVAILSGTILAVVRARHGYEASHEHEQEDCDPPSQICAPC